MPTVKRYLKHMLPPLRSFWNVADKEKVMEDSTLGIGMQVTILRSTGSQQKPDTLRDKWGDASRKMTVGTWPVCAAAVPPLRPGEVGTSSRGSSGALGSVSPTRVLQKTDHEKEGRSR